MVRSNDPFWVHVQEMSDGFSKCKFCGRMFAVDTSISRIKWHLSGVKGHGVAVCAKVPNNVQEAAYLASLGANKRLRTMPSLSNNQPGNATSTPQQELNNVNLMISAIERTLMEECGAEQEAEEDRIFSLAEEGNHVENRTREAQQPIQRSIIFEGLQVDENDTWGATMQPTDEADLLVEKDWGEIYASSTKDMSLINETNNTIATSLEGQNNQVENGAMGTEMQQEPQPMEVEMQQEQHQSMEVETQQNHQPLADIFNKIDVNVEAALWPLFEKLMSIDLLKFARKEKVDVELKKWESKLLQIHAVLNDAEERQVTNLAVKKWLTNLRDWAYDAEDILDGLQTGALRSKLNHAESQASRSTSWEGLPTSCTDPQPSSARRDMETQAKVKNITTRMEELVKEKNDLQFQTNVGCRSNRANKRVPTTSLVKEAKVYGRETVKEDLVQLLMSDEANNSRYAVIPIVGMGGVGKTTLAQLAYKDDRLKFNHKAWVCVSDEFDITRITKTILLHLGGDQANDLNILQQRLKDKLRGKKFFIVLDDIWQHEYDDWTTLCSPFTAGASGSKIIITTRSKDISSRISTTSSFELKELSYDECFSLFAQHAVDAENFDAHPDLKEVGQRIVQRCRGLPLAAKALGGLLRHKQHIQEWEDILHSEIWDLPEEESGILSALRLSYHHLPCHLKQCFAYCAIFPKDYEFDRNELVSLWMAEGFLQQKNKKKYMEGLGHEYFRDLSSRSFFQESSSSKARYVMHDLVRDLAQFVSGELCFNLGDKLMGADKVESYARVRYSSFLCQSYDIWRRFEVFYKMKNLRTFLALPSSSYYNYYLSSKVLDDLVPTLTCLRTLSLAHYNLKELPRSIGTLKHLRYLNLSFTLIERLPESLGELLNLQMLILHCCSELVELPACIGNLINLLCLDVSYTNSLREMPPEISKLKNLLMLPNFIVGEGHGLGIGALMKLPNLQGKLHITGLHNIANIQEAMLANLKEKQGLTELALEWSDDSHDAQNESHEQQVLNLLQPHRNLEKLSITSYHSSTFPSWVGDPSFTKMVKLLLCNCHKVTSLSSLGKLPVLRDLIIVGMDGVKEVAAEEFPSLETLRIEDMPRWEQWYWSNGLNEGATEKFPKLCELTLKNCPKLSGKLPGCMSSLKVLHVEECQEVVIRSMPDLTSVTTLKITRISGLVSLCEMLAHALVALEDLQISYCNEVKFLWQDGIDLDKLANLKSLAIVKCEQLVTLIKGEEGLLPCNIEVLFMNGCPELENLPSGLCSLTSLRELTISRCRKLASFPEGASFPHSLKSLVIEYCDLLESLPSGMMTMTNGNQNSNQPVHELEILWINYCPSFKSFPSGKLPATLRELIIDGCKNLEAQSFLEGMIWLCNTREMSRSCLERLRIGHFYLTSFPTGYEFTASLKVLGIDYSKIQSLPSFHTLSHLTELIINECAELESFPAGGLPLPNLTTLWISACKKLRSVPDHMDKLAALQHLKIGNCENLRQPMSEWGLCILASLRRLSIQGPVPGITDLDQFPDDDGLLLPASLTSLWISDHENLKCISRGLQHLILLENLTIWYCPNLQSFPKERFPDTLGCLSIRHCPLLEGRCIEEEGDYWPIIAHIPKVEIYEYTSDEETWDEEVWDEELYDDELSDPVLFDEEDDVGMSDEELSDEETWDEEAWDEELYDEMMSDQVLLDEEDDVGTPNEEISTLQELSDYIEMSDDELSDD